MMSPRLLVAALLFAPLAALPAAAQDYGRDPPAYGQDNGAGGYEQPDAGGGGYDRGGGGYGASTDSAGLGVRVGKLEGRIREMTGQIEELQNANRKLIEQLQKFQGDVDDRFASSGGRAKRSEAAPASDRAAAADVAPAVKPSRKGRDEAFDPDAAPKSDPGLPKPLGSPASAQHDDPGGAPMDLAGGRFRKTDGGDDTPAPTLRLPPRGPVDTASAANPAAAVGAAAPTTPREFYDAAVALYRDKQYDEAEKSFAAFLQKNPKSRLAADATYYLGESYAQRGRSREAAEQYLKVSTDFSGSTRAPDAMLHLGMSLKSLGAKEQACATFAEVTRKYPNAPAYVKSGAEREAKRAQCG